MAMSLWHTCWHSLRGHYFKYPLLMFLELPEQSVLCSQKRTSLPTSQSKLKWRKRPASPSQSPTPDPLPCPVTLETAAGPSSRVHSLHLGSRFLPLKSSQTSFCGLFSPMSTTSPFSWLRWGKYLDKPEALPILMNPQIKSPLLHIPLQPSSSSSPIRSSTTPNETLFSTHTQVIRPWEDGERARNWKSIWRNKDRQPL